eukprot:gene30835-37254_t
MLRLDTASTVKYDALPATGVAPDFAASASASTSFYNLPPGKQHLLFKAVGETAAAVSDVSGEDEEDDEVLGDYGARAHGKQAAGPAQGTSSSQELQILMAQREVARLEEKIKHMQMRGAGAQGEGLGLGNMGLGSSSGDTY